MDQEEVIQRLTKIGAIVHGHFRLSSGKHSDTYVNKDTVSSQPSLLAELVEEMILRNNWDLDDLVVVAPAAGAVPIGVLVALELKASFAYAEAEGKATMVFNRGFDQLITTGKTVLIVEDIVSTGATLQQMITAVEKLGGVVIGVAVLWLRGEVSFENYHLFSLVTRILPAWLEEDCLLCQRGEPINTEVNKHGKEFVDRGLYTLPPQ